MNKPFEHLCSLIDEFWQQYDYPVKPGQKPHYYDNFYLKLYWFAILFSCTTKCRVLQRAETFLPSLLKKPSNSTVSRRLSQVEPFAREFWRWLQFKLRGEELVTLEDVLIDSTCIEVVLYARVGESCVERFPDCNMGWKTTKKRYYFGKRLHLTTTPDGTILGFRSVRASIHDSRIYSKLNKKQFKVVTADSGYRGERGFSGQKLALTQPFAQSARQRKLAGKRVCIERVNNMLKKLSLEGRMIIKNSRSLASHLMAVLTCTLGIQYLNLKKRQSPLAYAAFLL